MAEPVRHAAAKPNQQPERRQALYDFKRKAILDAARRVLAAHGADGLTIRAVAAEAGYAPGAVYSYFRSRAELLAELHVQDLAALARSLREMKSATPHDVLGARLSDLFTHLAHDEGAIDALMYPLGAGGGAVSAEARRAVTGRFIALLTSLHEPLAKSGHAQANASALTLAAAASAIGLSVLSRTGSLEALQMDGAAVLRALSDVLLSGRRE